MYRSKPYLGVLLWICLGIFLQAGSIEESKMKAGNIQAGIDFLSLQALQLEIDKPQDAIEIYEKIFDEVKSKDHLLRAIEIAYEVNNPSFDRLIQKGDKVFKNDKNFNVYKIAYFFNQKEYKKSLELAKKNVEDNPTANNYYILGSIENKIKMDEDSLISFKKAYEIDRSESYLKTIIKIAVHNLGDIDGARKFLENDKLKFGCDDLNCKMLGEIYIYQKDYSNLAKNYVDIYENTKNDKFLDLAIDTLLNDKSYHKAVDILKKYRPNDKLIIDIYFYFKEYDEAYNASKKCYKETDDKEFLALMAMSEYEKLGKDVNKDNIKNVLINFEKSVYDVAKPIYYNYFGYLLIDHDIDVEKGMILVKKALEKEPLSAYYIDSLAWGYYKLNQCENALNTMNTIDKNSDFFNSNEAKMHLDEINKCLENK